MLQPTSLDNCPSVVLPKFDAQNEKRPAGRARRHHRTGQRQDTAATRLERSPNSGPNGTSRFLRDTARP